MFDITLIENIYNFLTELEKTNFICKDIKLKVVTKDRSRVYLVTYKTLNELYLANKTAIDNNKPNRYCIVGDYPFIENITIINNVTNYVSEYYYYNVTSNNPFCRDKTNFDSKRNKFYDFDKSKYIEYIKTELVEHNTRNIDLADIRLNSFVDVCYVDPGYVEKDPLFIQDSISTNLK